MSPNRVLVTGAAGFVGQHLLATLRRRFPQADILVSAFDITDPQAVFEGVAQARPDGLFHLAAIAVPGEARHDPDAAWRVNLHGTLNVARGVLRAAPDCVLLFTSSADAYGQSFLPGRPLDEAAKLAPVTAYGATKAAADLALGAMVADGLRCVRLRPFNHTGPGQSEAFAVPAFARQIARIGAGLQEPVIHVGALDAARDFLDVRDVCEAYAAALGRADALPPGCIFNLGSGQGRRMGDILHDLLAASGIAAEVRTDASRMRRSEIAYAASDSALARRLLDWAPRIAVGADARRCARGLARARPLGGGQGGRLIPPTRTPSANKVTVLRCAGSRSMRPSRSSGMPRKWARSDLSTS